MRDHDSFFKDCLTHLLNDQTARQEVISAAAERFPQTRKRVGALTNDQRRWFIRTWLPQTWWPTQSQEEQERFLTKSKHRPLQAQSPAPRESTSPLVVSPHAAPAPSTKASSPIAPRELFPSPDASQPSSSTRKSRSSTWGEFGDRAKADRVKAISEIVLQCCSTPEEASELLFLAIQKVNKTCVGSADKVAAELSKDADCCCRTLLPSLGKLRDTWLNSPKSLVSLLDDAVCSGGLASAKQMRALGYNVSNQRVRQWHLKKSTSKRPPKKAGRPSKVNNPLCIQAVRATLAKSSVAASRTCVVKEKQPDGTIVRMRKQRRTLTAQLSTIYRSNPSIYRNLAETQFRCLVGRHCQEFRKGFRKTDLCDHCVGYRNKILPRVNAFIKRCQNTMATVCPGYWNPFWSNRRHTRIMNSSETEEKLNILKTYLWVTHEKDHAATRRNAPEPWKVQHEEGQLVKELKLHLSIVQSYEWHILAAAREQASMRRSIETLEPGTCYFQADFSENIGVPIAHEETSDMWHGAARKTLSVFGVYLRQWIENQVKTRIVLYVSEVLEKSALFASLLIRKAVEKEVLNKGKLKKLIFVFDAGNHFRSYEAAHNTMIYIPLQYKQPCVTRYLVEKHGKGPCDAQIFSPMRRFLKQACLRPDFFAENERQVVAALKEQAAKEQAANPDGPEWVIEVPTLPARRPAAKVITMHNCQINRSYCFESLLSKSAASGVQIRNWIFSDSGSFDRLNFSVEEKAPEFAEWKKGYFQDPSWQKPPLELGCDNAITRKYQSQKDRPSTRPDMKKKPARTVASLCLRDERQLASHLAKKKRKYKAWQPDDSDISL